MDAWDDCYDFVFVGSGAGSVPAALVTQERGYRPLIIEKQAFIGGSSAFSGGIIWIPNNHLLNEAGGGDSPERSRTYLDDVIGDVGPASSPARRDAFIRHGAEMITFLESQGMRFLFADYPDYYDNRPGGSADGRALVAPLFDVKELGEWAPKLARHPLTSMLPLGSDEAWAIFVARTTWAGRRLVAKLAWRHLKNKLLGREVRGAGNALQGRLFQIALRRNIPIWTDTPVKDFVIDNGRVTGVVAESAGKTIRIAATKGVLVNAGGFSRNLAMREAYQPKPTSVDWTFVNPGDSGEMIEAMMALGAATDLMDEAWWQGTSVLPDGTTGGLHVTYDIGKPHCIVVGKDGHRFVNESNSYMAFGQRMYATGAVPAWAIFDSRHRAKYPWGLTLPGITPKHLLDQGYFKRAATLPELAKLCGIDSEGLERAVERFNGFARDGKDEDFQRGESAYNRYSGDPAHKPNPSLGTIEREPFYAVELIPGDVGTSGGVMTDEHARVLRADGSVIAGLYGTGNSTAAVTGRSYPGPGTAAGSSMVFGYIAALHAAGTN